MGIILPDGTTHKADPSPDDGGGVESFVDVVLDSEILAIEKVLEALNQKVARTVSLQSFDKEIVERFAEIGFVVRVTWFETDVNGVNAYSPRITIIDRIATDEFDHDQMVWEVTNDVLDLGEGGVIKSGKFRGETTED